MDVSLKKKMQSRQVHSNDHQLLLDEGQLSQESTRSFKINLLVTAGGLYILYACYDLDLTCLSYMRLAE